jgi:D-alanyl-D-alanine carboxypeptidase
VNGNEYQWSATRLQGVLRILLACALAVALVAPGGEALAKRRATHAAPAPKIAAAIVVDMNSGSILYADEADTPRYPASLTKMMTLYVLFGYLRAGSISLDSDLNVTAHAASQAPTKIGLKEGSTIKVADAIKALVTQSANDAAVAIAENLGGSEENFARLMTETARRIGMRNTLFRNASGLPNDEQVTTARDMATLAAHLIHDYPDYYSVFDTRFFVYKGRRYRNHNKLLFGYKGTDGIKTGYTRASGFNLTASVHRGDKHLVAVVLGGKTGSQRDAAMRAILDKNFIAASEVKPTAAQLASALVGAPPPSLPALKKPILAAAAATPVAAAAATPMAAPTPMAAAPATPMRAVAKQAEGDAAEPTLTLKASLPLNEPAKPTAKSIRFSGAYHVQVGAFLSEADAENRLAMVQQRALDLLDGHLPFTASFMKGDQEWFRARFAGFSKTDAQAACAALKKMSLECAVMTAE